MESELAETVSYIEKLEKKVEMLTAELENVWRAAEATQKALMYTQQKYLAAKRAQSNA